MKKILRATLTFVVLFGLAGCGPKTPAWQEQYDLGVRYLSEGNYEEAIIAFTAAIEIDPNQVDIYINLAQTYRALGEYTMMHEILRRGYEATRADLLMNILQAEEMNLWIEKENRKKQLIELYLALKNDDNDSASMLLEGWEKLYGSYDRDSGGQRDVEKGYYKLAFDGEKFVVDTEQKALIFWSPSIVYYGEHSNGIPHGNGKLFRITTFFQEGGIKYYCIDGTWENGVAVGETIIVEDYSPSYQQERLAVRELNCILETDGIMEKAEITERWEIYNGWHEFHYQVTEGKLLASEWLLKEITGLLEHHCVLHDNCDTVLTIDSKDFGSELFSNPYSWGASQINNVSELYGIDIGCSYKRG